MSTHLSQYHLVERIQHQIAHCSGRTALREWYASGEMQLTWFQAGARIRRIASALLSLGIDAQERVALFSHNSLNWSLADLATLYVRGVTVPIYASNTATQAAFIINDADIRTIFCRFSASV
nr:AMP-binding protein [Candidatus Symbiopectobacterium sp.]